MGGYPFRIELRCSDASAQWRGPSGADCREPKGFPGRGPGLSTAAADRRNRGATHLGGTRRPRRPDRRMDARAGELARPADMARTAVGGTRQSARFTGTPAGGAPLFAGQHVEAHARVDPQSAPSHPVLDLAAARAAGVTLPQRDRIFRPEPIDAEITTLLRGLPSLEPKPLPELVREVAAAGGQFEITRLRIARGTISRTWGRGPFGSPPGTPARWRSCCSP